MTGYIQLFRVFNHDNEIYRKCVVTFSIIKGRKSIDQENKYKIPNNQTYKEIVK